MKTARVGRVRASNSTTARVLRFTFTTAQSYLLRIFLTGPISCVEDLPCERHALGETNITAVCIWLSQRYSEEQHPQCNDVSGQLSIGGTLSLYANSSSFVPRCEILCPALPVSNDGMMPVQMHLRRDDSRKSIKATPVPTCLHPNKLASIWYIN